jgi:hypothetical protein
MELPAELRLDFVEEQTDYVCTDEPTMTVEDLEEEVKPMIEKREIDHDEIFSKSDAVKLKADIVDEAIQDDIPPPTPKPKVTFDESTNKKTKKDNINELTEQISQLKTEIIEPTNSTPVKLNKNGKPRKKRVYTEEQKEKMRERMKYARAQAYKNKVKKQEERDKETKYKELMKKKRDMEMEEVEEKIKSKSTAKQPKQESNISVVKSNSQNVSQYREVLKQAQLDAIVEYEKLRKARKQKKKQEQQVQDYNKAVKENIKKELGWRDVAGIYADCF